MEESESIQNCLNSLGKGDLSVRNALFEHAMSRLKAMANRMFRNEGLLRLLGQAEDVLQQALIKLFLALDTEKPPNVLEFMGLAALQMRRVRCTLAKRARAKPLNYGIGPDLHEAGLTSKESGHKWDDLYDAIDRLPQDEKAVFDLLYHHEMSQPAASEMLGIPLRTLKRRWQQARLRLREALHGSGRHDG